MGTVPDALTPAPVYLCTGTSQRPLPLNTPRACSQETGSSFKFPFSLPRPALVPDCLIDCARPRCVPSFICPPLFRGKLHGGSSTCRPTSPGSATHGSRFLFRTGQKRRYTCRSVT